MKLLRYCTPNRHFVTHGNEIVVFDKLDISNTNYPIKCQGATKSDTYTSEGRYSINTALNSNPDSRDIREPLPPPSFRVCLRSLPLGTGLMLRDKTYATLTGQNGDVFSASAPNTNIERQYDSNGWFSDRTAIHKDIIAVFIGSVTDEIKLPKTRIMHGLRRLTSRLKDLDPVMSKKLSEVLASREGPVIVQESATSEVPQHAS